MGEVFHMEQPLAVGDPVEVRMLEARPDGPGVTVEELSEAREVWWPATVTYVTEREIGVAFANSMRLALPRNQGRYRRP